MSPTERPRADIEFYSRRHPIWVADASVVERMILANHIVDGPGSKNERLKKISQIIGSGILITEAVPCAFALAKINEGDPLQAVIDAVNIGYDTDTVATITGALVGAFVNLDDERFKELFVKVQDVNDFDLIELASSLADVAHRRQ